GDQAEGSPKSPMRAKSDHPHPWSAGQPDLDLALDVGPFLGGSQASQEFVEGACVGRSELEPGEKVELFLTVPPVGQAPGDGREIVEADGDVVRPVLEDRPPLVLSEVPPLL